MSLFSDRAERAERAERAAAEERAAVAEERAAAAEDRAAAADDVDPDDELGPHERAERARAERQQAEREHADAVERDERRRGWYVVAAAVGLIAALTLFVGLRDDPEPDAGRGDTTVEEAGGGAASSEVEPVVLPVVDLVVPVRQLTLPTTPPGAGPGRAVPTGAPPATRRPLPPGTRRIVLDADILFPFDSPRLRPSAVQRLQQVAATVSSGGRGLVRITGYTDDLGTAEHGLVLSRQRAAAVSAFLRPLLPAPDYPFAVTGLGEADPEVPNTSEANRRKNRRVEVVYTAR